MKKNLFLAGLLLLVFTACNNSDDNEKKKTDPPIVKDVFIFIDGGYSSVMKGGSLQFKVTIDTANGADKNVNWSLSSTGHHAGTTISTAGGVLNVSRDETKTSITVKATPVEEGFANKAATKTITVTAPAPSGVKYPEYRHLVMAGYQGWFNAPTDGANRGWYHYDFNNNTNPTHCTIDFWPDITEYAKTYKAPFKFGDGTDAYLYSPYDEESVDLHFKWMKDYGIDGVFMQRFVGEVVNNSGGKNHFNKVLANALKAAKKYGRAIGVMYDLSGCDADFASVSPSKIEGDWLDLVNTFKLNDPAENPTYIWHNGRPLVTIWGVGFNDKRKYTTAHVENVVKKLKDTHGVSIMLGVPYWWVRLEGDTESNPALHSLIKNYADIIMPWAVGRYGINDYGQGGHAEKLVEDVEWCSQNGVDYVPLVFPGFTWGNMHDDPERYYQTPRHKGDFLWKQVAGAKSVGAASLYVAMFDEIDEGTAIYKCARESDTPLFPGGKPGSKFLGIEDDLQSDHYLWLVGKAADWFHGGTGYNDTQPVRN